MKRKWLNKLYLISPKRILLKSGRKPKRESSPYKKEIDAYQVKPREEDTRAAEEEKAWNEYFLEWGDFEEKKLALQKTI